MGSIFCYRVFHRQQLVLKKMQLFLALASLSSALVVAEDGACFSHVNDKCEAPGDDWVSGSCNSVHGGFRGNSDNLHRIIVDDFTDSMNYLLMASSFSTDKVNRMGFSKFFMDKSDTMWKRGKDMIKYVLKRGGKMGTGFQIPPFGETNQRVGDYDYSNEMKGLGVTLDLLEELSEEYTEDINDAAKKLNILGKMVRKSNSNALALHLFDNNLK